MIQSILLFLVGLFIGSLLNVISIRSIDGRDWVRGRSECDRCHHPLSFLDMIPVLSYIAFKGKCRYCGEVISPRHIISELVCGILVLISSGNLAISILLLIFWLNTMTDLSDQVTLTWSFYIGSIAILVIQPRNTLHLITSIGAILASHLLYLYITKTNKEEKWMGLGDIDGFILIYVYGGLYFMVSAIAFGTLTYLIILAPFFITKRLTRESKIPYIPALLIGSIIQITLGDTIWSILTAL